MRQFLMSGSRWRGVETEPQGHRATPRPYPWGARRGNSPGYPRIRPSLRLGLHALSELSGRLLKGGQHDPAPLRQESQVRIAA